MPQFLRFVFWICCLHRFDVDSNQVRFTMHSHLFYWLNWIFALLLLFSVVDYSRTYFLCVYINSYSERAICSEVEAIHFTLNTTRTVYKYVECSVCMYAVTVHIPYTYAYKIVSLCVICHFARTAFFYSHRWCSRFQCL